MVKVSRSDDLVTGIAGAALWGPLLDRLGVVAEADRRGLRAIGPGGYTGGECYRALLEVILAGGDVISDRSLLAGVANERLRGEHRLPSQWTLWRFGDGADLGRAQKAAAVNRTMLARAWALGAGPPGGLVTLDPDATSVATYGLGKEGSMFSYKGQTRAVLELLCQLAVVAQLRPGPQHQPMAAGARPARRVPPLPSQTLAARVLQRRRPRRAPRRISLATVASQPRLGRRLH